MNELACVAESLKPDIILVPESWCNSDVTNAFLSIDGYEIQSDLRTDREDTAQGRGGGLLVYVKLGLKVLKIDTECKFRQYCMFLVNDITFYLLYRSPNAPPQMMNDLECVVRGVKKNAILVGDFNLPDIDWEMGTGSARTASFLEAVDDVMLTQMVDFRTQVKGNCLDLVLTNILERIVDIEEAGRLGKSDHEMILFTVGGCGGGVKSNREVYNWGRADWTSMKNDLAGTDWSVTLHGKSADEMWTTFKSRLDELRSKHVPTRAMNNRQRPLWMT